MDPMAGSGTVLRQASDLGHQAIGFDMDPLAVLMGRVWTTPVPDHSIQKLAETVIEEAHALDGRKLRLPWIDHDIETKEFVDYWFAHKQQTDLRRISYVLNNLKGKRLSKYQIAASNVLRISLSRIIVTKEQGASLARDISHSRPHRVADESDYDVFKSFDRSIKQIRGRLEDCAPLNPAKIQLGDARVLRKVRDNSVDAVITSPPYLNAIDYMRGHRMSLVWLGHELGSLRRIRSDSIGAERSIDSKKNERILNKIRSEIGNIELLSKRHQSMIDRYIDDIYVMVGETYRVLKPSGSATFVIGDSCLQTVFVKNSDALKEAAKLQGLKLESKTVRTLPMKSRYLPTPKDGSLGKRMRTEVVLRFVKPNSKKRK